ncbi:serine protease [Paracoccaceae bacterium]|nr:serine protease [Paracoccaceae bacterium]
MTAYNKKHLGGSNLKKSENVEKFIYAVLALKTSPKPKTETAPVPIVKAPTQNDDTYKVASGTGFYVSDTGPIITNHHVIDGCKDMKVHSKGNVLETTKISEDRRNDLALLKTTESPKHSFALSMESPFPLQDIVVAGFPFGEKVSSTLKFTQGIVSSIAGLGNDYSQIQIDAALQLGNSGGPILDEYGNVVAVAVAKLSLKKILKDFGVVPENTNFGVKASAVRNLMEGNGVSFKSPNTELISKKNSVGLQLMARCI